MSTPILHTAQPDDAPVLTAIALASKAYWGYDAAFMAACVPELTVTAEKIARYPTVVITIEGIILGFAMLIPIDTQEVELEYLFVAPAAIGHGHGKRLFRHVRQIAQQRGYQRMRIQADPNAEAFYLHMGAARIGASPSDSIPGRMLPLLQLDL
jgi:GNAT superfamily N-acetyltransferase